MKRPNAVMAAIFTLALAAGVHAQGTAPARDDTLNRPAQPLNRQSGAMGPITDLNRASKLIGMNVYDPQNQKLGDIKDLALDLQSGKIGYAVLGVGGFLGLGEKDIAVPISALQPAPNGNGLLLNADKARIQNAPGLSRNNWPALNEAGQASYWNPGTEAQGTPGAARYGTGSGRYQEGLTPKERGTDDSANHAADNTGRNVRDRGTETLTPGDQSEAKADIELASRVRRAITSNDQLSTTAKNIKVIENGGKVTLRGPVNSAAEKEQIVQTVRGVQGVTSVDDQLEVKNNQ